MPDLDDLARFDQGLPPMDRLPAAEVRRRGDRIRRRRTALTTGAAALAVAIAVGAPVLALTHGDGGNDVQPAPSPASPSATEPPVAPQAWVTEIPAGFPIAPAADGWDVGTGDQVLAAFATCEEPGWVPGDARAVLGAVLAGGESSAERTLALFPTDEAAAQVVARLTAGVRDCPDYGTGQSDYVQPIGMDVEAGDEALAYVDQYGDANGPTGEGNAIVVTRVGNALLLQRTYFGGAGDLTLAQDVVDGVVADGTTVVDAMCAFAADPC